MSAETRTLMPLCFAASLLALGCVGEDGSDPLVDDGLGDTDGGDTDGGDGDGDGGDGDGDTGEQVCDVPSPYMGGWDIGCCQDEQSPTPWYPGGVGQGTVLPDWTFTDQFGDQVRIYDFCHNAIYFEYVAFW